MSLHLPPSPATALVALTTGLCKFGVAPGKYKAAGLPVYNTTPAELLAGRGPGARSVAAWRFLILAGGRGHESAVRTADVVRLAGARSHTLAAATAVGAANLLDGLIAAAGHRVTARGRAYTVRLAQFPGLALLAIWLDGPRPVDDVFLPLHPGRMDLPPLEPVGRQQFLNALQAIAKRKVVLPPSQ